MIARFSATEQTKENITAVEIRILWRDTLYRVLQMDTAVREKTRFFIGESWAADFPVEPEWIGGQTSFPLVTIERNGHVTTMTPPTGKGWMLGKDGQKRLADSFILTLGKETAVEIQLGLLRFQISVIAKEQDHSQLLRLDKSWAWFTAGSLILHALFFGILWATPSSPKKQHLRYDSDNRYIKLMTTSPVQYKSALPSSSPQVKVQIVPAPNRRGMDPEVVLGALGGQSGLAPYSFLRDSKKVYGPGQNTEAYAHVEDDSFIKTIDAPLSTFSIDVDTASYANVRRFLRHNTPPPIDAVRIEELINYFSYNYDPPDGEHPFSVHVEAAECPWNSKHVLAQIGILGRPLEQDSMLERLAEDVKIQVEFNPQNVSSYRLIGNQNRRLKAQDFNDDMVDAGEIGAGHMVTALYELIRPGETEDIRGVDPLRYQNRPEMADRALVNELFTFKLRFKEPNRETSRLITYIVQNNPKPLAKASSDFKFAAAVASFGMLLKDSPRRGKMTYADVLALARQGLNNDQHGYRSEFIDLVRVAQRLCGKQRAHHRPAKDEKLARKAGF